ncbi:MAG: NADH-quinone oxidoreductase subunit J [Candidatus Bathyarchaeia archaeon]|jgi:NADH:ubiquinone oxidoreductase subunit 6 (subunit J)
MSFDVTLILGTMLVGVTIVALMVRKLVWSLIMLFYSSIIFGVLLISYGATFAGLFHIITFAGAVSVLFMVILMIVGDQTLSYTDKLSKENYTGMVLAILAAIPLVVLVSNFNPFPARLDEGTQLLGLAGQYNNPLWFLWALRSWDLLLVVILVAAAMLGVMNLFSREGGSEK